MIHVNTHINGFNINKLQHIQIHERTKILLKTFRDNNEWSKLVRISASYLYLETGRRQGVLNGTPPTYIHHNI